jgi:hypothetical protein
MRADAIALGPLAFALIIALPAIVLTLIISIATIVLVNRKIVPTARARFRPKPAT